MKSPKWLGELKNGLLKTPAQKVVREKDNVDAPPAVRTRWEVFALLIIIGASVAFGYQIRRRMLLANYVQMLRSDYDAVSSEGISKLSALCPMAAPSLSAIAQNKSETPKLRKSALEALHMSGDGECTGIVNNLALSPGDEVLQIAALEVFAKSEDPRNHSSVRNVIMRSDNDSIRMKAIRLYARYPLEHIVPDLIKVLEDPNIMIALETRDVLERVTNFDFGHFHDAMPLTILLKERDDFIRRAETWWAKYRRERGLPELPVREKKQ
jgi:hypothetical protein